MFSKKVYITLHAYIGFRVHGGGGGGTIRYIEGLNVTLHIYTYKHENVTILILLIFAELF